MQSTSGLAMENQQLARMSKIENPSNHMSHIKPENVCFTHYLFLFPSEKSLILSKCSKTSILYEQHFKTNCQKKFADMHQRAQAWLVIMHTRMSIKIQH